MNIKAIQALAANEKRASFEGALQRLIPNPSTREAILNETADYPDASPMAGSLLETAGSLAPAVLLESEGAMGNAAAVATGANIIGAIAAAITKRRTDKEQADADTGVLRQLAKLIPGVSTYDFFKRIGREAQTNVDYINERRAKRAERAKNEKRASFSKLAQDNGSQGGGLWDKVKEFIGDAKRWWDDPANASWKPLAGAGIGAVGGGVLGGLLNGGRGFKNGAILGALGGGAYNTDWSAVSKWLDDQKAKAEARAKANASTDPGNNRTVEV